ncbi:zinc finger MYND domain-containing protein [Bacteriovoracaceae bacterium]|nr:zinc finger MYND domain-containing protein [Bacteriovoracaceae bacterium]
MKTIRLYFKVIFGISIGLIYSVTFASHNECNSETCHKTQSLKECGACGSVSYCGRGCQSKDWTSHKKVCCPFEIKQSGIQGAGKGVFVKKKIKSGKKMGYEGDVIDNTKVLIELSQDAYAIGLSGGNKVVIGNPNVTDLKKAGTLINDGLVNSKEFELMTNFDPELDSFDDIKDFARKYMLRLMAGRDSPLDDNYLVPNMKFYEKDDQIIFESTKEISSGDELIAAYGLTYWAGRFKNTLLRKGYKIEIANRMRIAISEGVDEAFVKLETSPEELIDGGDIAMFYSDYMSIDDRVVNKEMLQSMGEHQKAFYRLFMASTLNNKLIHYLDQNTTLSDDSIDCADYDSVSAFFDKSNTILDQLRLKPNSEFYDSNGHMPRPHKMVIDFLEKNASTIDSFGKEATVKFSQIISILIRDLDRFAPVK